MWVQFYFAGDGSMHSSRTPCSFIPDMMALLLLLPSAMKLVLPLHLLRGLPEPNGRVWVLLSCSADCMCLRRQDWQGIVASAK